MKKDDIKSIPSVSLFRFRRSLSWGGVDGSERKANVTSQNEVAVAVAVAVAVVVLRDRIYKNYGVPYGSL